MNKIEISETASVLPIELERAIKVTDKLRLAKTNNMPISIQAAIEDKCFNRCVMCDHPLKPSHRVDSDTWCDFITKASKRGLESVCYTGGDIFAYRDINKIMECHSNIDTVFGILCSGYVPKNVDIDLLKKAEWVRISLDTVDPELYSVIRGKLPIEKVFDSIDYMLENDIEVGLSPTIHNDNCNDIENVIQYAMKKGMYVDVKTAYPGTYPIDKIDWNKIYKYKDKLPLRIYSGNYHKFNKCAATLIQWFIDSKGDIYPCCVLGGDVTLESPGYPIGNINEDFEANWINATAFSLLDYKDRPEACNNCQGRFTEINTIAEKIINSKVFF